MVDVRRVWISSLLVMVLLGAGCAELDEPAMDDGAGDDDGATPADAAPGVNATTLQAVVAVLVNGTALEPENGTFVVPAGINVTFDASASANATAFQWTFTDANGTSHEAQGSNVIVALAPGNHTVTLQASSGNLTADRTVDVTAVGGEAGPLALVDSTSIAFSMDPATLANGDCASEDHALTFPAGTETRRVSMSMDPNWAGLAVGISFHVYLFDGDGDQIFKESRSGGNTVFTADVEGLTLPGGDYSARGEICGTFVPEGSFSVTGVADHYA